MLILFSKRRYVLVGGAYYLGYAEDYRGYIAPIAESMGCNVFIVEYGLCPVSCVEEIMK